MAVEARSGVHLTGTKAATSATVVPYDGLILGALLLTNLAIASLAPGMATSLTATFLFVVGVYRMLVASPAPMVLLLTMAIGHFSTLI